ncbi:hypothetical protein ABZW18_16970 [Streptomyces sp. NPDC004647]|uniref:hypothetical protein n=1 Tax=Streptomyces sp. NPDC004647 TaxID=3154671 RepID=UPI0033A3BB16
MIPFPRTRNAALVGAVCTGLAAVLVGCGGAAEDPDAGTNGVGKLSAAKIESKSRKAVDGAEAVRLSGSLVTKGRTYKLDMRLKGGPKGGGTGQLSTKGSTFELLRVGDELYLKADADFWASQKGGEPSRSDSAAASKLDDKYVKVPSGDSAYKQLSGFTDMDLLLEGLLGLHGKRATGDRGTVGGVRTIRITGGEGAGGSLDVSLEGTPYPLRLQRAGGAGVLQLADWNKEFLLKAPDKDHIVDYGRQITTS